ncbi:FAD-dependent oxidoreductase [Sinosporangium siamense]|uniref:FAD-dependent oxidoreductase n=1 Tax=Sinosporangium siamense TaxID=1367973 RepID=A0A919VAY6_9ACTN|nr:FAD-dependent oxidoreductase [Sinosporangium siamense]GII91579.1 FAD-dependent oxidoreductase [Sinosporangium siamense]
MTGMQVDVLVVGGGLGGVAAALAALRGGARVTLTESTAWLGGQLTSQAVPPDEHPWVERFGSSTSYRALREGIREYYRRWYPLRPGSAADPQLNPGAGRVSRLCVEPRAAVAVLDAMVAPWEAAGRLTVLREHEPVAAGVNGDRVESVTLRDLRGGGETTIDARYVLDATETGDLLPLTGTEYVTGFESRHDTGEPSAPEAAQPLNMQAVSVCFALEHREGEDHTVDKPDTYAHWRNHRPEFWPGAQLGWVAPHPHTLAPRTYAFSPNPDDDPGAIVADQSRDPGSDELWTFRRILARNHFRPGVFASDVTLVNWPQIDYLGGPVFEVPADEAARHVEAARQQSLSMLYWMQTEAPRPDGGTGWPGLRLRPDIMGTADGLAMAPYIRESRRILAEYRVVEQDLAVSVRGRHGAVAYPDSVGVGSYRIDLHPSTGGDNYIDVAAWPFEIPLRSLVPQRMRNLLAAGKNIGTTHITNGSYRLHPVEWAIGEAAGALAAHCLAGSAEPQQVTADERRREEFRAGLAADGVELTWPKIQPY